MPHTPAPRHVLITGLPHFVGRLLTRQILNTEPATRITLLVREDHVDAVRTAVGPSDRITVLPARIVRANLGIAPPERRRLLASITDIYHFASLYHLGVDKRQAEDINIQTTRNLLSFAAEMSSLRRFNHYSTAFVAGDRTGIILEEELDAGQSFRNTFERTKFTAELAVRRAGAELPVTIYRPALVVGSSKTGEMAQLDGPYFLLHLLANSPGRVPLSIPSVAGTPFNVVPADYVAEAMHSISMNNAAIGKTFHLADPAPIRAEDGLQLVAELANRGNGLHPVHGLVRKGFLALPANKRLVRGSKAYLHEFDGVRFFNTANTLHALQDTKILCPAFPSYAKRLVQWIRDNGQKRQLSVAS